MFLTFLTAKLLDVLVLFRCKAGEITEILQYVGEVNCLPCNSKFNICYHCVMNKAVCAHLWSLLKSISVS